jgi:hypothetical protein
MIPLYRFILPCGAGLTRPLLSSLIASSLEGWIFPDLGRGDPVQLEFHLGIEYQMELITLGSKVLGDSVLLNLNTSQGRDNFLVRFCDHATKAVLVEYRGGKVYACS